MELGAQDRSKPQVGKRDVSLAVRIFRLVGSLCCFGIMVNMFVCLARDAWTDEYALVPFIAFLTLLAVSIFVCRQEFLESIRSRRFRVMLNGMIQCGLALVVASFLMYAFGHRFHARFDLTTHKLNELSGETRKTLAALAEADEPVQVFLLEGEDPARQDPNRENLLGFRRRLTQLLDEYQVEADALARGKFEFTAIDVFRDPGPLEELRKRMKLSMFTPEHYEGVAFLQGERSRIVTQRDMFGYGTSAAKAGMRDQFQAERVFTATLRSLLRPELKLVCFTTGHGEPSEKDTSLFRGLLTSQNVDLREVDLSADESIPEQTTAVVVCGARKAFGPHALKQLESHLQRGGHLLAMLDPVRPSLSGAAQEPSGLNVLLGPYGLQVRQDYVTRCLRPAVMGDPVPLPFVPGLPRENQRSHIVHTLMRTNGHVAFPVACVVEALAESEDGYQSGILLESVPFKTRDILCWADPADLKELPMQPGPQSKPGPLPLAAFSRVPKLDAESREVAEGSRILAMAGVGPALDRYFTSYPDNHLFLLAALRWITREDELVSEIPPRDPQMRVADFQRGHERVLGVLLILGAPALLMFLGIVVWSVRRN